MALSTRWVRSYTGTATTPAGRLRLMLSRRSATAWETLRLFSPMSMNTVPSTTSRPFSVAAPLRSSSPMATRATSRTRMGVPSRWVTTMAAMSSMPSSWRGHGWSTARRCAR